MGQFDNVDLGSDKTMQRMIEQEKKKRNEIIKEIVDYLKEHGYNEAADRVLNSMYMVD